jgi:diguanylate cyclase (GGDEF)-like protein/PAS domain S-box-containing protein
MVNFEDPRQADLYPRFGDRRNTQHPRRPSFEGNAPVNGSSTGWQLIALLAAVAALLATLAALYWRGRAAQGYADAPGDAVAPAAAAPDPVPRAPEAEDGLFHGLLGVVHEAVVVHGDAILLANPRFANLLGTSPEDLVGKRLAELVEPEYAELVEDNVHRRIAGQPAAERYEVEVADRHGQVTRLELTSTRIDYRGAPAVLFTAVEMFGRTIETAARGRAQTTIDSLGDGLVTTDTYGRIDYVNRAAEQLLGRTQADVSGLPFADVVAVVDEADRKALADPVRQSLASGLPVSLGRRAVLLTRADGAERSIELTAAPLKGERGDVSGCVVLLHDVTELRGIARQMSYQASHDALTGLVNRREFERRLQESLEVARTGAQTHVLCYLDLDRFKAVNDTSGHMAGDNMLREVAALVKDAVRDSDTVARIGGDEFAMLLVGCPLEKAIQIAEDVSTAIRDYRFVWKDKIFAIGVSIGLVEIGRESAGLEDVLQAADSACYVAKSSGPGRVHVYSSRDEAVARHRGEIQWLQRLQQALREGRFLLYTQPIVAAAATTDDGPALEVLVRLAGDDGATIPPAEFLKAAERYRLMSLVDRWVVQTALAALGRGAIRLAPRRSLCINLSGQTLGDAQFLEFVVECLDRTGVYPSQVCFEVTEASVVANFDHARRFIGVLHGMGCRFALDDFGSGLGSFANLKTLSIDYLKIDGTYMRHLERDTVNQAMVAAMIKLARTLDFKVIAEQVEDQSSLDAARRMGIDYLQGYVIARPEPLQPAA